MKRRSGFTLVELVVAMGVFAILASIATPGLLFWINNSRLGSVSRQVFFAIKDARSYSIKVNSTTRIEFPETGNEYITKKWNTNTNDWHVQTHTLPPGVKMDAAFGAGRILTYNGRGFPGSMGNVVLSNSFGTTVRILVNINGSPRIAYD